MICLRCISRRLEASEVAWRDPPGPGATELPVPATKPLGPVGPSPAAQTLCNPSLFQLAFRPPRPCEILRDTSEHLGRAQVGRQYFEMVGALGALGRVGTVHSRSCTVKASPPPPGYIRTWHTPYRAQGSSRRRPAHQLPGQAHVFVSPLIRERTALARARVDVRLVGDSFSVPSGERRVRLVKPETGVCVVKSWDMSSITPIQEVHPLVEVEQNHHSTVKPQCPIHQHLQLAKHSVCSTIRCVVLCRERDHIAMLMA